MPGGGCFLTLLARRRQQCSEPNSQLTANTRVPRRQGNAYFYFNDTQRSGAPFQGGYVLRLDLFGNYERSAIGALQHRRCFVIVYHGLGLGIEVDGPAEAVGGVGQMHQCRRQIAFANGGVQVRSVAAAHTVDEIYEMLVAEALSVLRRPGSSSAPRNDL